MTQKLILTNRIKSELTLIVHFVMIVALTIKSWVVYDVITYYTT